MTRPTPRSRAYYRRHDWAASQGSAPARARAYVRERARVFCARKRARTWPLWWRKDRAYWEQLKGVPHRCLRRLRDSDAADLEALCEAPEPDPLLEYMEDYGGDCGLSAAELRGMRVASEIAEEEYVSWLRGDCVAPEHIALAERVYADGRRMQREAAEREVHCGPREHPVQSTPIQ